MRSKHLAFLIILTACGRTQEARPETGKASAPQVDVKAYPGVLPGHFGQRAHGGCYQSSQPLASESRPVSSFHKLQVAGSMDVILRQDRATSVSVEAAADLLGHIVTEVKGDRLVVRTDGSCISTQLPIRVYVAGPHLSAIQLAGSGTVVGQTSLQTKTMTIHVAGSGDVKLAIDSEESEIKVDGSGTVVISGHADEQEIAVNGSGNVEARTLKTSRTQVVVNGSANVTVHASDSLVAVVNGSGEVVYSGAPKRIVEKVRGSGAIRAVH